MSDTSTLTPPASAGAPEPQQSGRGLLDQVREAIRGGNVRQYGMIVALLALILLFQVLTGGLFLEPRNVTSLLVQNGYILILAIGMVMVIIAGHIDLSVGSVAAFVGAGTAIAITRWGIPWPLAVLLGLGLGILVGCWQGYWTAYIGIPAFIVTLAGMLLFRGLQLMILNAESVAVPEGFQAIANGFIPEMGPNTGYHNPTLVLTLALIALLVVMEMRRRAELVKHGVEPPPMAVAVLKLALVGGGTLVVGLLLASYKGVPVVGLILFGLIALYTFITQRTVVGRHIYAVGGNSNAARLSGVDTKRVDFLVMVNMSLLAAVAGIVFTAYLNAANPKDGVGFELDAIAAVFIGGAAVAGGVGTVTGSIVGGLVMGVLNLGLANMSVDANFIQIIKGLVLLLAVAFDVRSKMQGRPSFIGMIISGLSRSGGQKVADPTPVGIGTTGNVQGPSNVMNVAHTHADDVPEGVTEKRPRT